MAGFNFYINGNLLNDEPDGFEKFEEQVIFDFNDRILRFDYPATLIFIGDGYNVLEQMYQDDVNGDVDFEIRDDRFNENKLVAKCKIRTSNCEWNINKRTVEADIDDVTYQSRIFSNIKSEIYANANKSITQQDITPIDSLELMLFSPITGNDYGDNWASYDLKDCFSLLIEYLTDGTVGFASSWYDSLPNDERIAVIAGRALSNSTSNDAPLISIDTLFNETWIKFNLFLIIEDPLISPIIRLEDYDYVMNSSSYITVDNVQDLKRSLDFEQLYATMRIGSETFIKEFGTTYRLPYFQFLSFTDELYTVDTSTGGSDNELSLVSEYVIDTNVFEDVLVNDSADYEEDIFFVQYDSATNTATKGEYYDTGIPSNRFYNEVFLNVNVANRFNVAGNIILNNGLGEVAFRAQQTISVPSGGFLPIVDVYPNMTEMITFDPQPFEDDSTPPNFDDAGAYDPVTFEYTAPESGLYRFKINTKMDINIIGDHHYVLQGRVAFKKNGALPPLNPTEYVVQKFVNGSLEQTLYPTLTEFDLGAAPYVIFDNQTTSFVVISERTIMLNSGDVLTGYSYIYAGVTPGFGNTPQALSFSFVNSTFETVETPTAGGIYDSSDPNTAFINMYEANNLGIQEADWEQVRSNPTVGFKLNTNGKDFRICHGKKITRNFVTGNTSIEALYNRNQTNI